MGTGPLLSGTREGVSRRRRVAAAVVLVAVVLAGLAVHGWLPDSTATDIAGDALYALAAYAAVVLVAPRAKPLVAGAIALGWCVAIELLQLTPLPGAATAAFPPAMLVLGTVFDARDLVVYTVTVVVVTAVDSLAARRTAR